MRVIARTIVAAPRSVARIQRLDMKEDEGSQASEEGNRLHGGEVG